MMPETPDDLERQITARLDSATEHLRVADTLASAIATRGGSEQLARLLAASAEAVIAAALMLRQTRDTVDELADLLADSAGMTRAPAALPDSFEPDAIDRAWDDRKDELADT